VSYYANKDTPLFSVFLDASEPAMSNPCMRPIRRFCAAQFRFSL